MKLSELQEVVHAKRKERGFAMDPLRIFVLLTEELGEVGRELKKGWSVNYDDPTEDDLKAEIADVLVCLIALANQFDIDLSSAVKEKFIENDAKRVWKSASRQQAN